MAVFCAVLESVISKSKMVDVSTDHVHARRNRNYMPKKSAAPVLKEEKCPHKETAITVWKGSMLCSVKNINVWVNGGICKDASCIRIK